MAKRHEEYDWLNDPFDEKKAAEEREQAQMAGCSRLAVVLGLVLAAVMVGALLLVGCLFVSLPGAGA